MNFPVIHMLKYNLGCEIAFLSFDWDAIIVKRAKGAIPKPRKQRQYTSTLRFIEYKTRTYMHKHVYFDNLTEILNCICVVLVSN